MIKAIPTTYKGRQYRSRLEARWAAFFDLMGWQFEYEPFDLNGWIPDFALLGGKTPLLVEIKPVAEFPESVAEKIEQSGWEHEVLILGCTIDFEWRHFEHFAPRLGWIWSEWNNEENVYCKTWKDAFFSDRYNLDTIGITADSDHPRSAFRGTIAYFDRLADLPFRGNKTIRMWNCWFLEYSWNENKTEKLDRVMGFWNEAANLVQWKSPRYTQ